MKQHQVLTGSANPGCHCYGVGQIQSCTFWAYGSGCDLVVSSSLDQPIQIISCETNTHITAVECSETSGKIAVAYKDQIKIFSPQQKDNLKFKWSVSSEFCLKRGHGEARILSWNYESDQLLVGGDVINLWTFSSTDSKVCFKISENSVSNSSLNTKWRCVWSSDFNEKPIQLSFSPNSSSCPLFASAAYNECMIKVWYSRHHGAMCQGQGSIKCDFTFIYLMHPQPVIGFEWRKNFVFDRKDHFSNALISSCQDQICRIWCETKQPVSRLLRFQVSSQSSVNRKRRNTPEEGNIAKRSVSAPAVAGLDTTFLNPLHSGYVHQEIRHFHIAASINPLSDIPLLPAYNFSHQGNSQEGGLSAFTVHWLNNKFHQAQFLLQKESTRFANSVKFGNNENYSTADESTGDHDKASFTALQKTTQQLIKMWKDSRDALYSIHPADGSLLVWHIDWLDEDRAGKICQPQICFSSRIPMAFPSGDAGTLCPRMILFVNYSTQQNVMHSTSYMSFQSQVNGREELQQTIYSSVQILSKHNDGSLNLWQVSFTDNNDFSSITSISHSARFCGHCYHLCGILSHPLLPLMVTTATNKDQNMETSSELILWRVDPVGPLSFTGGLSELARVSGKKDHLFANVTWFPILLPSWCLGPDNNSPSTALIALDNNKLQIYQIVVDAGKILAEAMTPVSGLESDFFQKNLVSQQSSANPGCLLHLASAVDSDSTWGNIVFLETFPSNIMEASTKEVHTSVKFVKPFYVVMLEQTSEGAFFHTWSIVFSANLSSMKGSRTRRTTVQMLDSTTEEDSSDDEKVEKPVDFPDVNVQIVKISKQKLLFPVDCSVISACSWAGRFTLLFASEQEEHLYPAPYHFCTACSDGIIYFWSCSLVQSNNGKINGCVWNLWQGTEGNSFPHLGTDIALRGNPVVIKSANPALMACLSLINNAKVVVSVYECASSGGTLWKEQGFIEYTSANLNDFDKMPSFHLDWLSQEDGSFFLVIGVCSNIQIYSLAPSDMKGKPSHSGVQSHDDGISPTKRLVKQHSLDMHTRYKLAASMQKLTEQGLSEDESKFSLLEWTKITELEVCCSASNFGNRKDFNRHITVSWARDGMLVVASLTEMHVFSHWMPEDSTQPGTNKKLKQSRMNEDGLVSGLSELVDKVCPSLPQYHPHVLSELLNSGHLEVVRRILIQLAICMNGDFCDSTCKPEIMQIEKFQFTDQLSNLMQLCSSGFHVTPLPLHDLLGPDGTIKKTVSAKSEQNKESGESSSKNVLKDFFQETKVDESTSISDELDEILGIKSQQSKSKKSLDKVDLSKLEPEYFGKEHCKVIHEFLIHNQLPGLTSFDQMELMALADTLEMTNASNLKQQKTDTYNENYSSVGLTAGERGYAVSGSGAGALDSCGLRFVMALHKHLCLLNALPASNRSLLLQRGLNTCQFAWAFHSEAEEEILSLLPSVQRGAPDWKELKSMGAGWWIRSNLLLRRLIEQTARAAFLKNNNPLDASLFYLALNKKSVLCGLFRSVKDKRMLQFFQNNFKEDRWRRAALKNAFALMGKQRFQEAAAFFLLSGSVKDAVEVCLDKMKDIQLAIVICRLRENSDVTHHQLLTSQVLDEDKQTHRKIQTDCFLRSMTYWMVGDYESAVATLLSNVQSEDITDIFNFYVYLRSHPIVLRNRAQLSGNSLSAKAFNQTFKSENDQERKLIFQTAVVHLESGCPILALDSLTKLPKVQQKNLNQSIKKEKNDSDDGSLNNGTAKLEPVSEIALDVDWSQPVMQDQEDELQLDWSEEDSENVSDGEIVPVVENIPVIQIKKPSPVKAEAEVVQLTNHDVFAHHLRMNACFKIFVQEMKAIANAYSSDGGLLRSKLYFWLEDASNIFHRVFGLNEFDVDDSLKPQHEVVKVEEPTSDDEDSTSMGSITATATASTPAPSLHELILADNQDWKTRRLGLLRRRKWLQRHHNFLRTLLSYCNLHDSAFGVLATMRMELLLLLQESLQDRNSIFSLSSPLPHPSENIPLITSVVAMCKTVVADPLTHLSHMTKDILCSVLHLTDPPHPDVSDCNTNVIILCSQAAALSSCIYQSLCDTSRPSYQSQILKTDGLQNEPFSDAHRTSTNNLSSSYLQQAGAPLHPSSYVAPTTAPTQWPGVAVLQSMLNSDISAGESKTKIITLFCEATTSVYISLLVHALFTHNTLLMYRLANHKFGSKMWNAVFGGGVKLYMKYATSRLNVDSATAGGNKWRERLNHKVLSSSERKNSVSSSGGTEQSTYREKFVPPETSLWDWILTKPFVAPSSDEGLGFDSDAESDDESSVSSTQSDDDDIESSTNTNRAQQEDYDSYSWMLMRAGVVQTVLSNIQSFIPLAGFELTELSSNSPLLCSSIQLLQQWHMALISKIDNFGGPPSGFLPSLSNANYVSASSSSPAQRPAMLRYQVMLEPNNTPFEGRGKESMGCRRLWHSLVKKENLQEMFIKYIFHRKTNETAVVESSAVASVDDDNDGNANTMTTKSIGEFGGKVKILHKEPDLLAAFCINNVNLNCIAIASSKDIQEIDLSVLLAADNWAWVEDVSTINSSTPSGPSDEDFLFVSVPNKSPRMPAIMLPGSHSSVPWVSTSQTGQGANIMLKRQVGGIRRMDSHPTLPYYLTGHQDGAISMWEWGHQQIISQYQTAGHFAKVNNVHFSSLGNKISAVGADGYLTLWQVGSGCKPFFHHHCHDRGVNDSCFVSSSSVIATAGLSSNHKNVAVWDTLMPKRSILVKDFVCHEQTGAYCIQYLPRHRTLLVGGKNGHVTVYDDRCLQAPVSKFAAHETSVKCLAIDPNEKFYVTGSANGAVKVWDSISHKMLYVSSQEHSRSSIFRNFGSGTIQIVVTNDQILTCGADGSLKLKSLPTSDYWL